ncbi:AraC family transcriptional regulator [[Eubacterium] hominis]|uniref:AraC family transcriptional regulator n=1 Tax=[Eubacterium] hominis TaxID=2764325 RepID=UPI003A4E30B1
MIEKQEQRHMMFDDELGIEAYQLTGIVQKFPNHFHEFYVIGFMEGGKRHLWCKGKEYDTSTGDLILFNPYDNHYCAPVNGELLDYRAVNIPIDSMKKAVYDLTGKEFLPQFTCNLVYQSDIAKSVGTLYDAIIDHACYMEKQEDFYFLLENVLNEYAQCTDSVLQAIKPLDHLCEFMKEHFMENLSLDELADMANCSRSYLLKSFTKQYGISPYRYLQSIRIDKAKHYLEEQMPIIDIAQLCGFTDQSHFSNYFKNFIGITPKQYQRIFEEDKTV